MKKDIKFYCYFLPQFHECPYNNEWWGKGFTEWENVQKAKPLFAGHRQPRIPTGGYYDLSDLQTISSQFDEASEYGIDGFVFFHYWYEGKRPLGKPLDLLLANNDIRCSFSLCWANHSWTRSWKNRLGSLDVLIEQTYENTHQMLCNHYKFLNNAFQDNRYIRIEKRPLFQIYIPQDIPNLPFFINGLREFCLKESNTEIHICAMITAWQYEWDFLKYFDSATLHQPALAFYSPVDIFSKIQPNQFNSDLLVAIIRSLPLSIKKILYPIQDKLFNKASYFDYTHTWEKLLLQTKKIQNSSVRIFPTAFVDFDNTPRYKDRAKIIKGFTPELFGEYLNKLCSLVDSSPDHIMNVVFINAWNEWGEGMYLQSDVNYGNARLEQVKKTKQKREGSDRN